MNKWAWIIGGLVLALVVGYGLDRSGLGDEGRRLDPLIVVAERIESAFESEDVRSVRQIRPSGDSIRVKAMLLDGPTVDCMVGAEAPAQQKRSAGGTYDGVAWKCSAEAEDAELLDKIEARLSD